MRRPGDAKTLSLSSSPVDASSSPASISSLESPWASWSSTSSPRISTSPPPASPRRPGRRIRRCRRRRPRRRLRLRPAGLGRLLGGGEVEVLEQAAGQLGECGLVVERQRERVELRRGLFLDPRRDQLQPGGRGRRRSFAGQPFAGNQAERGGQGDFLGGSGPNDRVAANARFGQLGEVSLTPAMAREPSASTRAVSSASNTARASRSIGADRACRAGSWCRSRSAAESAAPRASATSARLQPRAWRRHAGGLARRWRVIGGVNDVDIGIHARSLERRPRALGEIDRRVRSLMFL